MKQFKLVASIVSALILSSTAFAHMSFKGEVMPANAPYNWTGYYGGLNVGIVNHTMNMTDTQAVSFNGTIQQVSNPRFTGGFQLGYRLQLDPSRISGVYGLEFSTNFSNARFKKEYGSPFALYQLSSEHALQTVCLLQLMGGIAAERTLLFLTAGMSWANITGRVNNLDSIAFFNSFSVQKNELGTAVGGGIEYAITDTISARIKVDVITPHTYSTSDNNGNSYQISNNIVQGTFGLNYTFA